MPSGRLSREVCRGLVVLLGFLSPAAGQGALPPVPFPPENPLTESKRVLGKILFWDEQLSSDNTIACGACHQPRTGGADPRLAVHPGPDGVLGTPDDLRTSPGVINADGADDYLPAPFFALQRQLTPRAANTAIMAMYAPELFWDGRAPSRFADPETGATVIAAGGAFLAGGTRADLAPPFGVMDLLDVQAFTASFIAGCP